MTDTITTAKLATSLARRLDELYKERVTGEDISADVLDTILSTFERVEELVEQRLERERKARPARPAIDI